MSARNSTFETYYDYLFVELADPRTNDWPLIRDPMPGLTIIFSYLYFVLNWGPKFMKDRSPYELKNLLIVYNFLQVLVSVYLFIEGTEGAWLTKYSWKCEPVDFSNSPHGLRVARGCYVYFIAKITELLDTVFFVLRKKNNQITFLHMYHHTVMPMISWGVTKYYPGGHGTFIGVINSFVHIIMYFYYMMSAMGPQYQKYLWWKKYITTLQLAQFCIAFLHSMQLLFYDCGYPRWSMFFTLPNAIFFYYLFSDFYNKAYSSCGGEGGKVIKNNVAAESEKSCCKNGMAKINNVKNETNALAEIGEYEVNKINSCISNAEIKENRQETAVLKEENCVQNLTQCCLLEVSDSKIISGKLVNGLLEKQQNDYSANCNHTIEESDKPKVEENEKKNN